MSKQKKAEQLGMNPSTASGRLIKDTLFKMAMEAGHTCFQCGEALTRDTFSIEHKEPWLDSEDPRGMYFDQDNIAFSHLSCNVKAARQTRPKLGTQTDYNRAWRERNPELAKERRKEQYLRTGK